MEKAGFQECEAALTPIPKHIFRSRLTWCCYEAARSYFLYAWSSWVASMFLVVFYVDLSTYSFWALFVFFFLFSLSFVAACPGYIFWNSIMARRAVLADVRALADSVDSTFSSGYGIGPEKWDEAASEMNSKLYLGGRWTTPYCFYDGMTCELFFRVYFIKPSFEGRVDKKSLYSDADNEKNSNLVARYQNKVEEQFEIWAQWFAGDFADESKESLPKETFRNRFTWNCYQLFKTYSFWAYMLSATMQSILISGGELSVFAFWFVIYSSQTFGFLHGLEVQKFTSLSTSDRVKYLSIITGVAPGTDNDRWDLVAKTMNSYLHDDHERRFKDLFFDGKDCFQFFEKRFKPLVTGKVKQTCTASYELVPLVAKAMDACV